MMARKPARPPLRLPRFEIKRVGSQWFFHVVASNGCILAHSETYKRKRDCLNGVRAVKRARTIKVTA